jgi:hypothetical protein
VTFGSHRRRIWGFIRIAGPFAHGLLSRGSQVRILRGAPSRGTPPGGEALVPNQPGRRSLAGADRIPARPDSGAARARPDAVNPERP